MHNSETYLLEKQAQRHNTPLSRAEIAHLYGRAQKRHSAWGKRLDAVLSVVRQGGKAPAQAAPKAA